jgi:hypothetical protein
MSAQVQFSVIENLFTEFGQVIGCECDSDDITEIANAFIVYLSNTGLKMSYQYQHQHQYQLQEQEPEEMDQEDDSRFLTLSEQWSECSNAEKMWWKNCASQTDRVDGKRLTGWNLFTMMKGSKSRVSKLSRPDGTICRP